MLYCTACVSFFFKGETKKAFKMNVLGVSNFLRKEDIWKKKTFFNILIDQGNPYACIFSFSLIYFWYN